MRCTISIGSQRLSLFQTDWPLKLKGFHTTPACQAGLVGVLFYWLLNNTIFVVLTYTMRDGDWLVRHGLRSGSIRIQHCASTESTTGYSSLQIIILSRSFINPFLHLATKNGYRRILLTMWILFAYMQPSRKHLPIINHLAEPLGRPTVSCFQDQTGISRPCWSSTSYIVPTGTNFPRVDLHKCRLITPKCNVKMDISMYYQTLSYSLET